MSWGKSFRTAYDDATLGVQRAANGLHELARHFSEHGHDAGEIEALAADMRRKATVIAGWRARVADLEPKVIAREIETARAQRERADAAYREMLERSQREAQTKKGGWR